MTRVETRAEAEVATRAADQVIPSEVLPLSDPSEQREIARKGGEAVSEDREHMAEIGRKGGEASKGGGNQGGGNQGGGNQGGGGGGNQGGGSGSSERGFAAMDPDKQREIARKGGEAFHGGGRQASSGGQAAEGGIRAAEVAAEGKPSTVRLTSSFAIHINRRCRVSLKIGSDDL